jgi:peptidoglycan hydrolase-like protein with peptidoglycan-binding domain
MNKIIGLLIGGTLAAATMSSAFAAAPARASASEMAAPQQALSTHKPSTQHRSAGHASMSRKHVEAIQEALNATGEKVSVDGVWGPKTRTALKTFQHRNGLKVTGHPDAATLEKLNIS